MPDRALNEGWKSGLSVVLPPTLALSLFHSLANGAFSPLACVGFLVVLATSLAGGLLWSSFIDPGDGAPDPLQALLTGMTLLSTLLMLLAFLLPFSAVVNFFLILAGVCGSQRLARVRAHWDALRFYTTDGWTCGILLVAAGLWSQENLRGFSTQDTFLQTHQWVDVFFHSVQVGLFANSGGASTLASAVMAHTSVPAYHYASYQLPALFSRWAHVSAYSATTGILAPLGMVWTGLAAHSLGRALAPDRSRLWGLGAVCAVLLLPDAAYQHLGSHWSSYFFFQGEGLNGPYGIAVLALAWVHVLDGIRLARWRPLVAGLFFVALSAFFKFQITVAYCVPPVLFLGLFFNRLSGRGRLGSVAAFLVIYMGTLHWLSGTMPLTPTMALGPSGALRNVAALISYAPPRQAQLLYLIWPYCTNFTVLLLVGIPLVLIATYGVWILGVLLLQLGVRNKASRSLAFFPFLMVAAHLCVALCLKENQGRGDLYEIIHKTFVWPYFAVGVWMGAVATGVVRDFALRYWPPLLWARAWIPLLVLSLVMVKHWGETTQSGMERSEDTMSLRVPRGLFDAGTWL